MITTEMPEEQFINRLNEIKRNTEIRPISSETLQTRVNYIKDYNSPELENLLNQIEARSIDHPSGWIHALESLYNKNQIRFKTRHNEELNNDDLNNNQLEPLLRSSNSFFNFIYSIIAIVFFLTIPIFAYLYWGQPNWKYTTLYTIGVTFTFWIFSFMLLVVVREIHLLKNLKKIFVLFPEESSSFNVAVTFIKNSKYSNSKEIINYISEYKNSTISRKALIVIFLILACLGGYGTFYLHERSLNTNYRELEYNKIGSIFNKIQPTKIELTDDTLYFESTNSKFKIKFDNKQSILTKLKSLNIPEEKIIQKDTIKLKNIQFSWDVIFQSIIIFILLLIAYGLFRLISTISKSKSDVTSSSYSKLDTSSVDKGSLTKTSFKDIAGYEQTKREMQEIVDFFRSPSAFEHLGADIPKNILLVGPPGTGKTQLARAVAVASKAEIFYASGSEFIELYVGVGASRLRNLFDEAKKKTPSIIFIDEIDALAKKRSDIFTSNREHDQTLNELLNLLDGFTKEEKNEVVFISATNREDVLDPAILQRMNRKIYVELPTKTEIEKIIQKHTENRSFSLEQKDISKIASDVAGFSGREINNLIKESSRQSYHRLINKAIEQCKPYSNNNSFTVVLPLNDSFYQSPVQIAGICPKGAVVTIEINGNRSIQVADDDEDGIWVTLQGFDPGQIELKIYEGGTTNQHFSQISFTVSNEHVSMGIEDIQAALSRLGITIPNIENHEIIANELEKHVIGQKQAIQILSSAVTAHYSHVMEYIGKKNVQYFKPNVLLIGPKSSGKTETSRKLAEILKVPYALIDARYLIYDRSIYTKEQLILKDLMNVADENVRKAQYGIVCIEKIDSVVNRFEGDFNFQDMISGLINGKSIEVPKSKDTSNTGMVKINTRDIFFILEGRFDGIDNIVKTRIVKESIKKNPPDIEDTVEDRYISEDQYHQFLYETNQVDIGISKNLSDTEKRKYLHSKIKHQDLLKYGFTSNLLKYLPVVGIFHDNNEQTIKTIIRSDSMNHLLLSYNKIAQFQGKHIELTDQGIECLIQVTVERNIGVDGFVTFLNDLFIYILNTSDIPDNISINEELIEKVIN